MDTPKQHHAKKERGLPPKKNDGNLLLQGRMMKEKRQDIEQGKERHDDERAVHSADERQKESHDERTKQDHQEGREQFAAGWEKHEVKNDFTEEVNEEQQTTIGWEEDAEGHNERTKDKWEDDGREEQMEKD